MTGTPEPEDPTADSYEQLLLVRAAKRLKRKEQFRQHLTSYLIVNGMLVVIWAIAGRGYFWPIWPILGWGVGLAFDAASLRDTGGPTPAQIEAEARRLRLRDEGRGRGIDPQALGGQHGVGGSIGSGPAAEPHPAPPPSPWDGPTGGPGLQDGR